MSGELICESCKGPVIEYEGAGAEGGNTRLQRWVTGMNVMIVFGVDA